MSFIIKQCNALSAVEVHDIYKLRCRVFVVEQQCVYQDVDDKDLVSFHVLMHHDDRLIGYSRIIPPGISYEEPSIGRVAIEKSERKKQAGRKLMEYTIQEAEKLFPGKDLVISAQCYLTKFYTSLGFVTEGPDYLEDDIPH